MFPFLLLLGACSGAAETAAPPGPAVEATRPKGKDRPGDPERRSAFLAGVSALDAAALVATNNPLHIDAVAAFFADAQKPYPQRIVALAALRTLRNQDPGEYSRVFPRVSAKLWEEVSHSIGMEMSPENEKAFIEAVGWLSDQKDPQARLTLELHLDRETVRRKRLPDRALCAAALSLASYPESSSAGETLWAALRDSKESPSVRACCLKALRPFHPKNLEALIVELRPASKDEWLLDLQRRLR
jgi:hypothetical protein